MLISMLCSLKGGKNENPENLAGNSNAKSGFQRPPGSAESTLVLPAHSGDEKKVGKEKSTELFEGRLEVKSESRVPRTFGTTIKAGTVTDSPAFVPSSNDAQITGLAPETNLATIE